MAAYVPPYTFPSATQESCKSGCCHYLRVAQITTVDYADLPILDMASSDTAAQRELVSRALMETGHGFFYVVNHGLSRTQVERMFAIGDLSFTSVGEDEKRVYEGTMAATGSYQGYKLRQYWHLNNGVRDEFHRNVSLREHPVTLRPYLRELEAFAKHNHVNVLHPLLRLLASGIGLPEESLVEIHGYASPGDSYVRFLKYYPRPQEEEDKSGGVWLKGHTDFGSITLLYSQPVAALQILSRSGEWKWVKHIENALVVNAGDALELLTGGVYRATIHRVIQPPPDQRQYARLGMFYFAMPDDDVKLAPLIAEFEDASTKLGFVEGEEPTMEAWRRERTRKYGRSELKKNEAGDEEEIIQGVPVKHYN